MPTLALTLIKLIPIRWAVYAAVIGGAYLWHVSTVRDAYQRGKTDERAAFVEDAQRRIGHALEAERRARDGLPAAGGVPDNDGHRRD
jgi:hypothetical protein